MTYRKDETRIEWDYELFSLGEEGISVPTNKKELLRLYRDLGEALGLDTPPPF